MRGGVPGPAVPWPCPSTEGISGPRGVRGVRRPRPGRAEPVFPASELSRAFSQAPSCPTAVSWRGRSGRARVTALGLELSSLRPLLLPRPHGEPGSQGLGWGQGCAQCPEGRGLWTGAGQPCGRFLPPFLGCIPPWTCLPPGSSLAPPAGAVLPSPALPLLPLAHSPGALEAPRPLLQPARGRRTSGPTAGGWRVSPLALSSPAPPVPVV